MDKDWSQMVECRYSGSDARFDLPVRPIGPIRWFGLILVGFGILFVWTPAQTTWHAVSRWLQGNPDSGESLLGLFTFLFVIAGCVPIFIGLFIIGGRSRVEWRDGRLRAAEILGPLRWSRRIPRKPVRKLEVAATSSKSGTAAPRELPRFSALAAEFEDGSRKMLVMGYPRDWLVPLAHELGTYAGAPSLRGPSTKVEVVERSAEAEVDDPDATEQPAGSRVEINGGVNWVRLRVPPAGIWKGSKGLIFFALVWCAFTTVFTVMITKQGLDKGETEIAMLLFMIPFWLIGLGVLAAALNMGRRTALIEVESGQKLRVETRGLFGTKRKEWRRDEIAFIRADASGMEVNDRPVIELQIHPRTGKKTGVLAGRSEEELQWMATRLRAALKVPAR